MDLESKDGAPAVTKVKSNLNHNLNPNRRSVSGDGGSKSMKHGEDGGNKLTQRLDLPLPIRWF
ncbi:hypothetical protein RZS08_63130, partial [Arthrospira platensis SPKY1]|nr:hypothetical protein [Arthrospira platensis SPKY1]